MRLDPAADGDGSTLQLPSFRSRRALAFSAIGLGIYLIALLATIPAAKVVPEGGPLLDVSGTAWRGAATLDGGNRLEWRFAPLRALVNAAFAADWTLRGPGTDIGGQMLRRSGGRLVLDEVSGRGDGSLLRAVMPNAPFVCQLALQLDVKRLVLGGDAQGARGEVRSDAGSCRPAADPTALGTAVPPVILVAEPDAGRGTTLSIAPLGERRNHLVEGSLSHDGHVSATIGAAGAAVLPFAAPNGGLSIDTQL